MAAFVEVNPRQIGRTILGIPVRALGDVRPRADWIHLAAVGQPGARDRIRSEATRLGLREGVDFYAVA